MSMITKKYLKKIISTQFVARMQVKNYCLFKNLCMKVLQLLVEIDVNGIFLEPKKIIKVTKTRKKEEIQFV